MKENITQVDEIPQNVKFNDTLEISSNNINYFTHGFFKYPCKFIPHIPRWAILKYTCPEDLVLDPFAGSGTTLVEAVLQNRRALGIDFDKLSQLLCITKTTNLSHKQITYLCDIKEALISQDKIKKIAFKPDIHNLSHWFPKSTITDLLNLREKINKIYLKTKDKEIYNFLLVCFAATIRKCSYADAASPKPYVSKRFKKGPLLVKEVFSKLLDSYLKDIEDYKGRELGGVSIISEDARKIATHKYDGKVSLAITSPPYINAFDYVRSLRLENSWLGFYGDSNIIDIKKRQVGTEVISSEVYRKEINKTKFEKLNSILNMIYKKDKKRAFVVHNFFEDMEKNLIEVRRLLKDNSHYIIVVGDSKIRGIKVPTHEILVDFAKQNGFELVNLFSYIIKNRYLRIPRSGKGGLIKKDWVIDLVKKNG